MWSKSNSLSVLFVGLATVLVCLYATGLIDNMITPMRPEFVPSQEDSPINSILRFVLQGDVMTTLLMVALGVGFVMAGADLPVIMICGTLGAFVVLTLNQQMLIKYLSLSALLFVIGAYGMTVSRNAVRVLMSIELMLNAVNMNMVAFARYVDPVGIHGQVFAIFILVVAAAEAAVGLAIVLAIYRNMTTVDMERFNLLKW
jgi:NAD(P)H-quinone oxidoreductase subunit 4L